MSGRKNPKIKTRMTMAPLIKEVVVAQMKAALRSADLQGSDTGLDDMAEAIATVMFNVLKSVDVAVPPHAAGGAAFPAKIV